MDEGARGKAGHVDAEREGEGGLKAGRAVMPESLRAEISTSLFSTRDSRELARSDRRSLDRARARLSREESCISLKNLNNYEGNYLQKRAV